MSSLTDFIQQVADYLGIKPPPIVFTDKISVAGKWIYTPMQGSVILLRPDGGGYPLEFVVAHELFHEYVHKKGIQFKTVAEEEVAANEFACRVTGMCHNLECNRTNPLLIGLLASAPIILLVLKPWSRGR